MKNIDISPEKLLETGAHFGHQYRRWNPKMAEYMHDVKDKVYIFDLIKTKECLSQALEHITESAKQGKTILFVGTKKQADEKVKEVARKCNCPYVSDRWLGGTLTNFEQMRRSIRQMQELEEKLKTAKERGFTKKEILLMNRKLEKMQRIFGGIINLEKFPELMIIIDTHREKGAVKEAKKLGIEVIGVVDSNADPSEIDYVIPMNDDAKKALDYVIELMGEAVMMGKGKIKSDDKNK
jgi:small subunit ribosomal protein S2